MIESELYTITKQYHEKKGIDIWVVRLDVRVDDDTFAELKGFAKELHGYYSTFYGVNGFVFNTENSADKFGAKLDDYLRIEETEDTKYELNLPEYTDFEETSVPVSGRETEGSNEITETEEIPLDNFCTALKLLIEDKGVKIITDTIYKTVDALKNIDAFKGVPPSIEFILRTIIMRKYGQRLLDVLDFYNDYHEIVNDFTYNTGFKDDLGECVFECLAYAVGKIDKVDCTLVNTIIKSIPSDKELSSYNEMPNVSNFYKTCKQYGLWCVIFEFEKYSGNPHFAMFRNKVEKWHKFAYGGVHKIENGFGFEDKEDFDEFVETINNIKDP